MQRKVRSAGEYQSTRGRRSERPARDRAFLRQNKTVPCSGHLLQRRDQASPDTPEATFAKARIEALKDKYGEDALRSAPEKAETGAKVAARRKLHARVDTVSRPDYVGPPVVIREPDEVAPGRPRLRTSPIGPVPPVEPPLPAQEIRPSDAPATNP